jgi:hypothetical protein
MKCLERSPLCLSKRLAASAVPVSGEVHEHEVNIGALLTWEKLRETQVERRVRCFGANFKPSRNLGRNKVGLARPQASCQCPPHTLLVVVAERGVNVCVAHAERSKYRRLCHAAVELPRP